jgi:hypothetical protein
MEPVRWFDYFRRPGSFAARLGFPAEARAQLLRLAGARWKAIRTGVVVLFVMLLVTKEVVAPLFLQPLHPPLGRDWELLKLAMFALVSVANAVVWALVWSTGTHMAVNRSLARLPRPCCLHCGYNLSGADPAIHCPECGRTQ